MKKKNLLSLGTNSFLLDRTPFQKGLIVQESKYEITKGIMVKNLSNVSNPS